MMTLIYLCI
jgi:RNA-binding protein Musashi